MNKWDLTFYIKCHFFSGCLQAIKFGCAGDVCVVVLLLRDDNQSGLNLPEATMNFSVKFIDIICSASAPCEFRYMGGAGMADWTGDGVGTTLNCCLWVNQSWFWSFSYEWKKDKAEIKKEVHCCYIENWYGFKNCWKVCDILIILKRTQLSTKENLSILDVSVPVGTNSIRKQKGPLSWSLISVISKVQFPSPKFPNNCVRPRKFSTICVWSSW